VFGAYYFGQGYFGEGPAPGLPPQIPVVRYGGTARRRKVSKVVVMPAWELHPIGIPSGEKFGFPIVIMGQRSRVLREKEISIFV